MRPLLLPLGLTALLCLLPALAPADNSMPQLPAPEGAQVYFITPQDGASVGQTFTVRFGLKGMGVAPAGVDVPATGHHHLLVDVDKAPAADQVLPTSLMPENGQPLPAGPQVLHFGKAQTETQLTLTPGKHTLQLVLGDKFHVPFKPSVESKKITVTVK